MIESCLYSRMQYRSRLAVQGFRTTSAKETLTVGSSASDASITTCPSRRAVIVAIDRAGSFERSTTPAMVSSADLQVNAFDVPHPARASTWAVSPTTIVALLGATLGATAQIASLTDTNADALSAPMIAHTLASPRETPVTSPTDDTLATNGVELRHTGGVGVDV
jgi:hypothetical protein